MKLDVLKAIDGRMFRIIGGALRREGDKVVAPVQYREQKLCRACGGSGWIDKR